MFYNTKKQSVQKNFWRVCFLFFAALLACSSFLDLNLAFATAPQNDGGDGGDMIVQTLCHVINVIDGNVGRAIAIIIVLSLAISLFLGKVTWGTAIAIAVGLGVLFGAPTFVSAVTNAAGNKSICAGGGNS